jgi:fused signal recognition particle receptor
MVFNWFRRKFDEGSDKSEAEQKTTAPSQPEPKEESPSEEQTPTASSPEDYLKWAKAAYQNIQKKQQQASSEEATTTETPVADTEPAAVESAVTEALEEPETVSESESIEQTQESVETEPETINESELIEQTQELVETEPETINESELIEQTQELVETEPETVNESESIEQTQESVETEPETVSESESIEQTQESVETEPETINESESIEQTQELVETEPETINESESIEQTQELVETEPETVNESESIEQTQELVETEPETINESESIEQTQELVETEPETITESESIEQTQESVETEPETISEVTTEAPQTEPLSFFARAEAERKARLERLQAEAIETPVAEEPTIAEPKAVEIPELPFDEGFVWSAEVLAAQGRRPEEISVEEITWLKKLRQGLDKTRRSLVNQLKAIVGQGPLNKEAVLEIEELLLQADVGIEATDYVIEALQNRIREETLPPDAAIAYLKKILRDMLDRPLGDREKAYLIPEKETFNIWLITGVNGAGKTTTIGKLAHLAQKSDYHCLIAAADTFRAAAVEQVKVWGARSGIEVIANPGQNTDPASVVFDAIAAARSRKTELLLVDTAGRLQNKKNLMDELNKIRRIIDKQAPDATIESLLVLDATLGQNGLRQAEVFAEAAQLSGVILTKLDGTAKGGVALAVVQQLGLPIRFIGAGEGIEDLRPFSSYEFVEALLNG